MSTHTYATHWFVRSLFQYALALGFLLCMSSGSASAQQQLQEVAEARSTSASASSAPAPAEPAASAPVQDPVNLGGYQFNNSIEVGYRWRDVQGNENLYRSQVNLGNGVKLLHSSSEIVAPESSGKLFDRLAVNLDNWGGDPYNTLNVDLKKNLIYEFQYQYRKIDYFNFLPDFANPFFNQGILFGQHSVDTTRRMSDAQLDIFPDAERLQIHLGYGRNSAYGPGFTTANLGGDEFVLNRMVKNTVNDFRIGLDVRVWKLGISVEQRVRKFKNDEGNTNLGTFNIGNDPGRNSGQQLFLADFFRNYYVRGTIPTTRFAIVSHKIPRVLFNARLYYSDADVDADYSQVFTGLVLNREVSRLTSTGLSKSMSEATKPYTIGDGNIRVAITKRWSVMNTFRGAHFVLSGGRSLSEQFIDFFAPPGDPPVTYDENAYRRVFLDSFMNQFESDLAITNNLIIRGAGEPNTAVLSGNNVPSTLVLTPPGPVGRQRDLAATQNTNTFIVGGSYRFQRFVRVALDYENGGYLTEFVNVDPRDFQRGRLRFQFRPSDKWLFTVSGALTDQTRPNRPLLTTAAIANRVLTNQNRSRSSGFSVSYFPFERLALDFDYTRGHVIARITTFNATPAPYAFRPELVYLEDSNVAHAGVDLKIYKDVRTAFGYRIVNSNGSYPISFHRPYAHLSVPFHRTVALNVDYQYYGYNPHARGVYSALDYQANLLTSSLKFTF